jgi:hypothetical protein
MMRGASLGLITLPCLPHTTTNDNDIATVTRNFGPGTVFKIIHKTMLDLRKNKNCAILQQSTDLAPTIGNETRWASAGNTMNK